MKKTKTVLSSADQELFNQEFPEPIVRFKENLWQLPPPSWPIPLRLDSAGITWHDPGYHVCRPEGAMYYVLEYIVSGSGTLLVDGHTYTPGADTVYLLAPGVPHKYYTDRACPWEKIWFNVSGMLIDLLLNAYSLPGTVFVHHAQETLPYFRRGLEIVQKAPANGYVELAAVLHQIIATASRLEFLGNGLPVSPEGVLLKEYLDSHWKENVTLPRLAKVVGKSPVQTLRIFSRDWSTTPYLYQQELKQKMARQYLKHSDYPVREIARLLGFSNEFHFSGWFKRHCGVSPKYYRLDAASTE